MRKRGKDFWAEFEFYLSDLLVGLVMDVVLVGLMAPVAVLGASPHSRGTSSRSCSCLYLRFLHRYFNVPHCRVYPSLGSCVHQLQSQIAFQPVPASVGAKLPHLTFDIQL